jgi:hypothetical protein
LIASLFVRLRERHAREHVNRRDGSSTVKFHVSRILAKFGMEDRRGLLPKGYDNPEIISR